MSPTTIRCLLLVVALLGIGATRPAAQDPERSQGDLVPDTTVRGPVLPLEFPEIHVGIAEYREGPTGTTVFFFPEPVMAAIDVRGGAPGVVNSGALRIPYEAAYTNAICFSGGSSYGLSAATGVADALKERSDRPGSWEEIAFVPGAIIFDLGGRRLNAVTPDAELGKAALRAARPGAFPLGAQGAGRFAMQGWHFGAGSHSGQGGAFRQRGETKVAVFTVVNALGTIVDREGRIVRCGRTATDDCGTIWERIEASLAEPEPEPEPDADGGPTKNTTLTLVVTNEKLSVASLQRLAIHVHGSMSRAIQPFSTSDDGDTLIAVTTGQVATQGLSETDLGVLASEVAWDAVLASVPELSERGPQKPVSWTVEQMDEIVGEYRFSYWASIRIERDGDTLLLHGPGMESLYFPAAGSVRLVPVSADELVVDDDGAYRLRIERREGRVVGVTLEPGPWAQLATRVDDAR